MSKTASHKITKDGKKVTMHVTKIHKMTLGNTGKPVYTVRGHIAVNKQKKSLSRIVTKQVAEKLAAKSGLKITRYRSIKKKKVRSIKKAKSPKKTFPKKTTTYKITRNGESVTMRVSGVSKIASGSKHIYTVKGYVTVDGKKKAYARIVRKEVADKLAARLQKRIQLK